MPMSPNAILDYDDRIQFLLYPDGWCFTWRGIPSEAWATIDEATAYGYARLRAIPDAAPSVMEFLRHRATIHAYAHRLEAEAQGRAV